MIELFVKTICLKTIECFKDGTTFKLNIIPTQLPRLQDQKILELMLARRSEQASQRDQRDMAYMQWEAERSRTHTAPPAHSSGAYKQASSSAGNSRRRQSAAPSTGVQQLRVCANDRIV